MMMLMTTTVDNSDKDIALSLRHHEAALPLPGSPGCLLVPGRAHFRL